MELKGDKRLVGLMLSGQQVQIPGANLFITQPTINQIVTFGEDNFLVAVSLLSSTKNLIKRIKQGNSELQRYSDFQLLMIVLQEDESIRLLVDNLFTLIFPDYLIRVEQASINFLVSYESEEDEEELQYALVGQIHPYNFENFQNLLYDLFTPKGSKESEPEFNPANEAAASIAAKLQKGREKRAEQRGPQSLFGIYCSILSIGLNIDINTLYNYTPFQLYDAYNRFASKMESDFYTRVSTMPFMDVSKMDRPEEWTRNLY